MTIWPSSSPKSNPLHSAEVVRIIFFGGWAPKEKTVGEKIDGVGDFLTIAGEARPLRRSTSWGMILPIFPSDGRQAADPKKPEFPRGDLALTLFLPMGYGNFLLKLLEDVRLAA